MKTRKTRRTRAKGDSSLVIKLNLKMTGMLIAGFLSLNILILVVGIFGIFIRVEEGALAISETMDLYRGRALRDLEIGNYKLFLSKEEGLREGSAYYLKEDLIQRLPISQIEGKRQVFWEKEGTGPGFFDDLNRIHYIISPSGDHAYAFDYALGRDLKFFAILLLLLLFFEGLMLLSNFRRGTKLIGGAMSPLYELAEMAKQVSQKPSRKGTSFTEKEIRDLVGALAKIDVDQLDQGVMIDSWQDELKDLAFAINEMLNRIDASYQAQIRFVSDASHELRTPISVVQGYINLLDRWGKKDEKIMQESIDAIRSETQAMKDLVEQLLFLARGDNASLQLNKEVFDACQVVEEITKETRLFDDRHEYCLDLKGPALIEADKQLIKQAVRILVDNSIKFTPEGEKIFLKVFKKEDSVHILIQDSGIGIAGEDLSKIFDRFFRSDLSRARKTGGAGLGLSIAKWIVERHEAYFELLSRVDFGTRVTIILPSFEENIEENIKENLEI